MCMQVSLTAAERRSVAHEAAEEAKAARVATRPLPRGRTSRRLLGVTRRQTSP